MLVSIGLGDKMKKDKYNCVLCSEEFELTKAEAKEMKDDGLDWYCRSCFEIGMIISAMAD